MEKVDRSTATMRTATSPAAPQPAPKTFLAYSRLSFCESSFLPINQQSWRICWKRASLKVK
jgi:hypothetical protein